MGRVKRELSWWIALVMTVTGHDNQQDGAGQIVSSHPWMGHGIQRCWRQEEASLTTGSCRRIAPIDVFVTLDNRTDLDADKLGSIEGQ